MARGCVENSLRRGGDQLVPRLSLGDGPGAAGREGKVFAGARPRSWPRAQGWGGGWGGWGVGVGGGLPVAQNSRTRANRRF